MTDRYEIRQLSNARWIIVDSHTGNVEQGSEFAKTSALHRCARLNREYRAEQAKDGTLDKCLRLFRAAGIQASNETGESIHVMEDINGISELELWPEEDTHHWVVAAKTDAEWPEIMFFYTCVTVNYAVMMAVHEIGKRGRKTDRDPIPTAEFYCAECGDPIAHSPTGEIAGSADVVCRSCSDE
jgi:hypothetical protein